LRVLVFKTASAAITRGRRIMRNICRTLTISICTALLAAGTLTFADADARSISYDLNIPSEDLTAALQSFAIASHHKLLYKAELTTGKVSRALKGHFTAQEAIEALLSGTGLSYEITGSSVVLIKDQRDGKTSDLREDGNAPESPRTAPQSTGGQPMLLAQVDQEKTTGNIPVGKAAQDTKDKKKEGLEEIVVTGTHIYGAIPAGTSIRTIDRAEIERSGYSTVDQLIQSLPENFRGGAGGASADANLSGGTYAGFNSSYGSGVNLRGLGNSATLVLVNGHRVASSGGGYFTDISTIPLSSIDHIEILTDGASAIYGSDAIAGVVNIVLKNESQGVEFGARYGAANDFSNAGGNLQIGHRWEGGGATLGVDFLHSGQLDVSQRSFTDAVPSPTSIFPEYKQTAVSGAAHQKFGSVELHGDLQYTHRDTTDFSPSIPPQALLALPEDNRWSGSVGATYHFFDFWTLRYDVAAGIESVDSPQDLLTPGSAAAFYARSKLTTRFSDQNLGVAGDLFDLPAGPAKLAIGASYRTESFSNKNSFSYAPNSYLSAGRNVKAAYGEFQLPIVAEANAMPGLNRLTLSAAVRYDRYSDFGGTTNPKFGISFKPLNELELRGAYSTSFRAPTTGFELANSELGTRAILVRGLPGPDGAGSVPVAQIGGGRPNLRPETATNQTYGVEYKPLFAAGLRVSLDYYRIVYSNQLGIAPFSFDALSDPALTSVVSHLSPAAVTALVNAAIANGAQYRDFTRGAFGPDPLASTEYVYDLRTQNLSKTRTSGFDLNMRYPFSVGSEQFAIDARAIYVDEFSTQLTPTSQPFSYLNTLGYPARLRAREQQTWTHGDLNLSVAANYVNSYPDTSAPTRRDVASFTTFDCVASYSFQNTSSVLRGTDIALSAINVLNRAPPYVYSGTINLPESHYDPANASPLGRLVTLSLLKRW
jgi:iron complex outermembrane receptor protein